MGRLPSEDSFVPSQLALRPAFRRPAFLALSCIGSFASDPAIARDVAGAAPANDEDMSRADDIIVKGVLRTRSADPKQVAPIVDTPRSIVMLDRHVIEQTGSSSLQDALRNVPGITFGAAEGGNPIGDRPFIRGFDSQGSIYVDGVRDLASQNREVFAIDSAQIVRGSDSTLGGRGSAGGTINILTKMPKPDDAAKISTSYGNGNYKRIAGDINVALGIAAFRIQGVWHDQDFVDRDSISARRWGIAPSVTIGLGTATRLTAAYYHLESRELPDSGIPYLYVCNATACNAPDGNVFTVPAQGDVTTSDGTRGHVERSAFYGLADRDFRDATSRQATLRVEHDFGHVTLRNTARFSRDDQAYSFTLPDDSNGDVFGFPLTGAAANVATGGTKLTGGGYVWRRANTRYGYTKSLIDQTDVSGTFNTGAIKHSATVGAEISWEKTRRGAYVLATGSTVSPRCDTVTVARYYCTSLFSPNPADPWVNYTGDTSNVATPVVKGAPNTETQNDANTVALYGFDSIALLPRLILNLGARYDRFTSTVTLPFGPGATAPRYSRTDALFNWQAGLVFKPTRETSIYASYATAATPPNSLLGEGREDNALPSTAAAAGQLDQLKAQTTRSYEVGAKASLFREKLALGLAVFQTDIRNARVTIDADTVGFLGRTRIRGVEFTASGTLLPGWTVFGGYTYLDPVIIDGGNTALAVAANGAAAATTVYVPSVTNGRQVPQTAKHSFTMTSNYAVSKRIEIGASAIYTDRQYGGYADNRSATQTSAGVVTLHPTTTILSRGVPAYWRFDARASYRLTRHVELAVNAQNLADQIHYSNVYANHYATIAPGRTVFGTVNVSF
ncbi:MAG: TonB-dependent receptor [Sphingomonas sp.]